MKKTLTWKVKCEIQNRWCIDDYDIFGEYLVDFVKKYKKKCPDKESFAKEMKDELMYHFWGRCEWEVMIKKTDDRIILYPWCGAKNPEEKAIDVTNDTSFDWAGFADKHIATQIFKDEAKAKIDVWDQIEYRWEEFIDYVWYTRLPYERDNIKFHKEV